MQRFVADFDNRFAVGNSAVGNSAVDNRPVADNFSEVDSTDNFRPAVDSDRLQVQFHPQ